jgi:cytochrome P450
MLTISNQTILSVNPWVFHRNPELFGEDCNTFNPDRWLQGDIARMDFFLIHVSSLIYSCHLVSHTNGFRSFSGEPDTTNVPDAT